MMGLTGPRSSDAWEEEYARNWVKPKKKRKKKPRPKKKKEDEK